MLDAPPSPGRLVSNDPRDFDADRMSSASTTAPGMTPTVFAAPPGSATTRPGPSTPDDVTAAALADLLDVLPDNVADLDPGIGWQADAGSRIVLGETTVRRTRLR
jgi:hypothetical protein